MILPWYSQSWFGLLCGIVLFILIEVLKRVPRIGAWLSDSKYRDLGAVLVSVGIYTALRMLKGEAPLDALQSGGTALAGALASWAAQYPFTQKD